MKVSNPIDTETCIHHWVVQGYVDPPQGVDCDEITNSKGELRFRQSFCRKCEKVAVLKERELVQVNQQEEQDGEWF